MSADGGDGAEERRVGDAEQSEWAERRNDAKTGMEQWSEGGEGNPATERACAHEPSDFTNDVSRRVIGAAIEVHRHLGPGFLERVYEEALAIELTQRGIRFQRQVTAFIDYKGVRVGECQLDLLVEKRLVLELKAVERLVDIHSAQVLSYLRAHSLRLGLLLNFNVPVLRRGIRRILNPRS